MSYTMQRQFLQYEIRRLEKPLYLNKKKPVSVDQKCKKKKIEKFAQGLLVFFSTATTTYVNKSRNRKLKKTSLGIKQLEPKEEQRGWRLSS